MFRDFKFELPGSGVRHLDVNLQLVNDPAATLKRILDHALQAAELHQAEMVRQFASVFSQKHGVRFEIEESAVSGIVERARKASKNVTDYCNELFKDYPYGLKLLRDRNTSLSFTFPVSALDDPDKFLSDKVVEFYRYAKRGDHVG